MRAIRTVVLVLVGFLGAWQWSSRGSLPRIPQPDDTTLTLSDWKDTRPRVRTPLGGVCAVGSVAIMPSLEDPSGVTLHCDAFTLSGSAIYTHENDRWVVWSKEGGR